MFVYESPPPQIVTRQFVRKPASQIPSNTLIELTAPVAFKRFTAEPD